MPSIVADLPVPGGCAPVSKWAFGKWQVGPPPLEAQMSVVMMFGAGALVGLVALTVVFLVTLLTEKPLTWESEETEAPDAQRRDRSVL